MRGKMQDRRLMAATFSLLVAACVATSEPGVREQLDERTGVTVISMRAPLEFFSPQPERGLQATAFVYLGPLEVNRMGTREILLWLSVLQGADARSRSIAGTPDRLHLRITAGGNTVEPAYASADARQLGLGRPVYGRPAHWASEAFYSITPREIAQMAAAGTLTLEISAEGDEVRRYELWKANLAGLRGFAERIDAVNP